MTAFECVTSGLGAGSTVLNDLFERHTIKKKETLIIQETCFFKEGATSPVE